MSDKDLPQEKLQPLVAGIGRRLLNAFKRGLKGAFSGGNSPEARSARASAQPRDRKGRWVATGASLRANISVPDGRGGRRNVNVSNLKSIGSTPDGKKIRALITNDDYLNDHPSLKEGNVIELSPKNAELLVARLDREFLKKKGIDPDLQHDLPKTLEELPDNVEDLNAKEADELDIQLALGGLTDDEDKDRRAERDAEPLAKLPPALAEQAAEGQEVRDIVESAEKGEDLPESPEAPEAEESPSAEAPERDYSSDDYDELKSATAAWLRNPKNNGKQIFYVRNGKARRAWVSSDDGFLYKGFPPADLDEGGEGLGDIDDFIQAEKDGLVSLYQGNIPRHKDGKELEGWEVNRVQSAQNAKKRKAKEEKAAEKAEREKPAAKEEPKISDEPSGAPKDSDKKAPSQESDDLDSLDDEDFEDLEEPAEEIETPDTPEEPEVPETPETPEEPDTERQDLLDRIEGIRSLAQGDPEKREVLDNIAEARKSLNRGRLQEASEWLDEAEAVNAEIDKAKANKKREEEAKANLPTIEPDEDNVDRTIGGKAEGELAKEMGKPGSKQREYFWETVDRIAKNPKAELSGIAQGRISEAYDSEFIEDLKPSMQDLDADLAELVDGNKTRAEVVSALKDKYTSGIDAKIKAIPRERLPRSGNRKSLKNSLEFQIEDLVEDRLDSKLPELDNKLKPAGREYSKEELNAMSRIDRVNAIQGLEPITEEAEKTPVDEIAKQNTVEDFAGDFGTLPNGKNIIPSEEQKNIVSAVISDAKRVTVNALAGSGKTTTLVGAANALKKKDKNARVFVWQFGRDNREQAQARFDKDTSVVHTFDSAGYNYGDQNLANNFQKAKEKSYLYNISDEDVAAEIRIDGDMSNNVGENLTLPEQARLVRNIVDRFSYSADTEITERHIFDPGDSLTPENKEKLLTYARRFWRTSTASTSFPKYAKAREGRRRGGYTGPGSIPPTNNILTKKWALTNPDLSKITHSDGSPITHVFVDEAQDINPVISNLLENQGNNVQIVTVGDSNQAIYAFRGAVDGLSRMSKKSEIALKLTKTRRFGKGLLDLPNAALNILGYDSRIDSELDGGEYSDDIEIDGSKGVTAVIVRNNYNGVSAILGMLARGKKVAVPRAFKEDLMDAVTAMEWLDADPDTRGSRPKNFPEDFANISSMKGLAAFARNKDNARSRATFWHRILNGDSFEGDVKKLKDFSEKVSVFGEGTRGSDFSGEVGAKGILAKTDKGDIEYEIRDGKILLSGKGMGAKGQNSNKNFRYLAFGGQKLDDIRRGENPNWIQYLPGGERKPEYSATWRIVRTPKGEFETFFEMPNEAERKEYLENLSSLFAEDITPDAVITTAHRSKGLEFDNVIIGDDFPGPGTEDKDEKQTESGIPSIDEINLAFVAVTRAMKKLSPGSLAWLSEYQGEQGLNKANSELGRANTPNPYKEDKQASATESFDFSDIVEDTGSGAPLRPDEDPDELRSLADELNREPSQVFEVSPDSFEGNIGSYFEDPDAEGVYVKLTDFVRSEDEDGEPLFELYGKYADGSDFEGVYNIDRTIREVIFSTPERKKETPAKKPDTETPAPQRNIVKTKAADIIEGSTLYDSDGNEMGEVLSKKKQVQKSTGREVVAVTYRDKDGKEQLKRFFADSDVDVDNKDLDQPEPPKKKENKAQPKTVAKTDGESPEVAQAKSDWADYIRIDNEWSKGAPGFPPMDPRKKKERNDKLLELAEKYPELGAENKYAQEFLKLQPRLEKLPKELKGSDYEKALRTRLLALRDTALNHRRKFVDDLDKGKVNLKEVSVDESLFTEIPEPANTPVNRLNATELPTIFGSSWTVNRDGTFSKNTDGVRWNIRENLDGSISVRNRTHGGGTQRFASWSDAEAAFPDLVEDGKKKNRDLLKSFISPYDTDGSISKMIDDGASPDEIHDALMKNDNFLAAIASREILPISYLSKIDRLGDGARELPAIDRTDIGDKDLNNPEIPEGYVKTPAGILPSDFSDREDDGSEFDIPEDIVAISDLKPSGRQEELEQLFRSFPNAKYAKDGSVVLYRQTKREPHGPKKGQPVTTEMRVQSDARQNKWNIIIKVTDNKGASQEFIHYSGKRNSWRSLIGIGDETAQGNGVSDLLMKFFNRDANFFKRKGKRLGWGPEKIAKEARNFGGVFGALNELRTAKPQDKLRKILENEGKGQNELVLRTIEEHAAIVLSGIGEELSTDRNWWRKRFSGVKSFWNALETGNRSAAAMLYNNFVLSIPNNEDARTRAAEVLRDGIEALYPGAPKSQIDDIMSRVLDNFVEGKTPEKIDVKSIPFVDKFGNNLEVGDHVQWESNVYGKSVGRIVRFLPFDGTKDGKFNYTDYVMVKFEGKKKPERLVASHMKKTDKDTPITQYSFWLRNDDLKIARAEQAGYSYDPDRHAIIDSDGDVVEFLGQDDSEDFDDTDDGGGDTDDGGGDTDDGDDLFGDGDSGDGGDGGDDTPTDPTETPGGDITETSTDDDVLDISNLTPENIKAGEFSNPSKKIKITKANRTRVGEVYLLGNDNDLTDDLRGERATEYYNKVGLPQNSRPGIVDDPENTITLKDSDSIKTTLKIKGDTNIVVVKPSEDSRKAKDALVKKGQDLWEKAKKSERYQKVLAARAEYENSVKADNNKIEKLSKERAEVNKELFALLRERADLPGVMGFSAYSDWSKNLPDGVGAFTLNGQEVSEDVAEKLKTYGGNIQTYDSEHEPDRYFDIHVQENIDALKKYLDNDTSFSKEEIGIIIKAHREADLRRMGTPTFNELIYISSLPNSEKSDLLDRFYSRASTRVEQRREIDKLQVKADDLTKEITRTSSSSESRNLYDNWANERALFMRDYLRSSGVQMGTRSDRDFGDSLVIVEDKGSNWDQSEKELLKAFNEALSFMPDAAVDSLVKHLKTSNNKLEFGGIKTSVGRRDSRGNFSSWSDQYKRPDGSPSGTIKINIGDGGLSSLIEDPRRVTFSSRHTDTALHELWHFVQYVNPNLGAIENTYMFDKFVSDDGIPKLSFGKVLGYEGSNSLEVGIQGMFQEEYMSKLYSRIGINSILNPQDRSSELSTVLMQGMFTEPNNSGKSLGRKIRTKEGKYFTNYVDSRDSEKLKVETFGRPLAYFNPADGKYYADSAFSIQLEEKNRKIVSISGKPAGDSAEEDELMGLAMGIMYAFDGAV